MSKEAQQITRSAGAMTVATAISRLTGLLRDILKAHYFGTGLVADAFTVAFRLPNLLRRLLGEGTLSAAFIPVYADYRLRMTEAESWRFVNVIFNLLTIVAAAFTLIGMAWAEPLVRLFAPGFALQPEKLTLTVNLTVWLFPYLIFVVWAALAMAVLNSHKRFFLPALAPIFLNLASIFAMMLGPWLGPEQSSQIYALAWGTLIGGLGQFVMQLPALKRIGFKYELLLPWKHEGVRQVLKLMGPGLFALGVAELNIFVDTFMASMLEEGSVAALEYASRLMQLPLGIFAVSISTAVLPGLSERVSQKDLPGLKHILNHTLRLIFFIMLPASLGLVALQEPIIALVYQRGVFDQNSAALTGAALVYYSLGLVAYGGVKVAAQAFFAQKDTATPVKVGVVAMLTNIVLNFLLIKPLKIGGLALATSISSFVNMALLLLILRRQIGILGGRALFTSFCKSLALSLIMAFMAWLFYKQFATIWGFDTQVQRITVTIGAIGVGVAVYAGLAKLFNLDELQDLTSAFRRKR